MRARTALGLVALLGSVGCFVDEDPYAQQGGQAGGESYSSTEYGYAPQGQPPPPMAGGPQVTTTVESPQSPQLEGDQLVAAILAGVRVISQSEYVLTPRARDLFFQYVGPAMPEPIQMVPESRGLRIRGITPGRVLAGLGFQNDDLVMAVDGRPIRTAVDALSAFTGLQGAGSSAVQIERGGVPLMIRYRVE
ncbi:MAG: hypothetical protein IT379_21725 [Deltaproteobacteria bacterium]|nr:hypothetical protein [Deltaproteobacteria bacterium]